MTHVPYLLAGWGTVSVGMGVYSWTLIQRGKRLAERVPVEKQRWMTSDDAPNIGES